MNSTKEKTTRAKFTRLKAVGALAVKPLVDSQARERRRLLGELTQVRGLMPLLMKPRNNEPWTRADREEILRHLHRLSSMSPYLLLLVLPGSFLLLPLFAWWMDRRRGQRPEEPPKTA